MRIFALISLWIIPTVWSIHITGKCACSRASVCPGSRYWLTERLMRSETCPNCGLFGSHQAHCFYIRFAKEPSAQ